MDNYDDNIEELDEASSSSSSKLNIGSAARNIGNTTKNAARNTGRAVEGTGKAVKNTGKAVEGAGKVAQKAGQLTQKAGQGIDKAGDSMLSAGKALSSSGYGAIAGVPLSILGGVTKAAGLGTQAVGKGTELAGKGTEAAGKGVQKTGEGIEKTGKNIDKSIKIANSAKKNIEVTGNVNKNKKISLIIIGAVLIFAFIFSVCLMSVIAKFFPIFATVTYVGGDTVYGNNERDLPVDLTENGIKTWNEEEQKIFETLKNEKDIFNSDFSKYNANGIKSSSSEIFDVVMPLATIHYMGVVNLQSFDLNYSETIYSDGSSSNDYNGESNVENQHTKDFYQKASLVSGNTFMIYPGLRMLSGNLIANNVSFDTLQYIRKLVGYDSEGNSIYEDNASDIYSDWRYLGQITSPDVSSASNSKIKVSQSINNIENAISVGTNFCNSNLNIEDKFDPSSTLGINIGNNESYSMSANEYYNFLKINACYDVDSIYDEIFGEKFDGDIVGYLNDKFKDDKAKVPTGNLVNGQYYITVSVNKKIDYEKYQNYLKEVYIPYYYINCENCKYKDAEESEKEAQTDSILKNIMKYINTFKYYNNEELIYYQIGYIGGSGTHGVSVDYNCDNGLPGYGDYLNHDGIDINGVPEGTKVYPLFGGTVIQVGYISASSTCYADCDNNTDICICKNCASGMDQMGNYVAIKGIAADGEERIAYYLHFSSIPDYIKVGEQVDEYTVIGYVGTTGCSTGNHLHIDFRDTDGLNTYKHYGSYAYKPNNIYTIDALRSTVCSRIGDNDEE